MSSITLKITGMTCGHCQKRVEAALSGAAGVYAATVDLAAGSAEIELDERRGTVEALIAAVDAVGYGAEIIN